MHPRLSVTAIALPQRPVARDIELFAALGIPNIGVLSGRLEAAGWAESVAALKGSPVGVGYLVHPTMFTLDAPGQWARERDLLDRSVAAAAECGAPVVYTTTGPAGRLTWEQAVDALAEAAEPCVGFAERSGAGYRGLVDVELLGPRIDEEGPEAAMARGAQAVSAMLDRLDGDRSGD